VKVLAASLLIIMLIVGTLSYFFIPWFFTGIDDRCWYPYSLAVDFTKYSYYFQDILIENFALTITSPSCNCGA